MKWGSGIALGLMGCGMFLAGLMAGQSMAKDKFLSCVEAASQGAEGETYYVYYRCAFKQRMALSFKLGGVL